MNNIINNKLIECDRKTVFNLYPSRNGQAAKMTARKDPVVYAPKDVSPPIAPLAIEQYNKHGFVVLDDVFSSEEVSTLQQELERLRSDKRILQSNENITEPESGALSNKVVKPFCARPPRPEHICTRKNINPI